MKHTQPHSKPHTTPPHSLERLLTLLLPTRDHETIAGDLHEAFADHARHTGRLHAVLWYARQVLSFTPQALVAGLSHARVLALLCAFTALCGLWLGVMGLILHHPHWQQLISGTIIAQALLTLTALTLRRSKLLQRVAMLGCLAIFALAAQAIHGMLRSPDFEGYIFLIGLALLVQGSLTLYKLSRKPSTPALR